MSDLGTVLIDVALSLALVYLVLSIVVSGAQEWVSQVVRLRSGNLRKGIVNLVGELKTSEIYDHGLIKGLYEHSKKTPLLGRKKYPSYIPSKRFAEALISVLDKEGNQLALRGQEGKVSEALDKILPDSVPSSNEPATSQNDVDERPLVDRILARMATWPVLRRFFPPDEPQTEADQRLKQALKALAQLGDDERDKFRDEIARWYDDSMERVSGWYARKIRWIGLIVAAVVVITMNADSLRIAYTIWKSEAVRTFLAETGQRLAQTDVFLQEGQVTLPPQGDQVPSGNPQQPSQPNPAGEADAGAGATPTVNMKDLFTQQEIKSILSTLPLGWPCPDPKEPPVCVTQGLFQFGVGWLTAEEQKQREAAAEADKSDGDVWDVVKRTWKGFIDGLGAFILKVIGWSITIFAVSLGAPFWFDLLKRVANLRAGGTSPAPPKQKAVT